MKMVKKPYSYFRTMLLRHESCGFEYIHRVKSKTVATHRICQQGLIWLTTNFPFRGQRLEQQKFMQKSTEKFPALKTVSRRVS